MRRPPKEILSDLISTIEKIIPLMRMDTNSDWIKYFEGFLGEAKEIAANGFELKPIQDLCQSIHSMYEGKGPFTEYSPTYFDSKLGHHVAIPGTEDFDRLNRIICDLSFEIRVIGSY